MRPLTLRPPPGRPGGRVESRPPRSEAFAPPRQPGAGERSRGWSARVAIALAFGAVAAAVAAAVGPAEPVRVAYAWPPATVPDLAPERTWFAPVMLNRRTAESVRVDLPCRPGRALPDAGEEVVLLATARNLAGTRALAITWERAADRVRVGVGSAELAAFAVPPGSACRISLAVDGNQWELARTGAGRTSSGTLAGPVAVNGLVTELDLRASPRLRVEVAPTPQDTRPSALQTVLRLIALGALLAALWLALRTALARPRFALRRLLPSPALPDLGAAATLLVWWIVAPISFDDGWVAARQTNAASSGGFSNYYDHHAANLPYATWLESLQRLVVAHTNDLVFQRIPSVLVLAALWLVVRHTLARLTGPPPRRGDAVWWTAAAVFCVGAVGFGVTLRPEPVIALLAAGVLLAMISFARRPGLLPLAAAGILGGLAVTAHPQGLAALAAIVACAPRIVRESRARVAVTPAGVVAVALSCVAWTLLLAFLDSDLRHRLDDASLMREGETHGYGLLGEVARYDALLSTGASPIRKEFVALAVLCVLAFLTRGPLRGALEQRLPALSLGLGLVLLAFTPSKWIWHFGVLAGVCAVAVAVEIARLREDGRRGRSRLLRPTLTATAVLLATIFATWSPQEWGPLDIRDFWWHRLAMLVFPFLLLLAGLAAVLVLAVPGRRFRAARVAQRSARWSVPIVALPLLSFATLGFVADGALATDWAFARQNVMTIAGRPTCGVADAVVVAAPGSARPVPRVGAVPPDLVLAAAPAPPAARADVFGWTSGTGRSAAVASPWYRVPASDRRVGVYVAGTWRESDTLVVTWGRAGAGAPMAMTAAPARVAYRPRSGQNRAVWRLVAQSSLPPRPRGANALRLHVRTTHSDGYRRFVSSPVLYAPVRLSTLVARPSAVTLASPFVFPMVPCARLPVVAAGIGGTPNLLVDWNFPPAMTQVDSPFGAIPDLYQVRRLPTTESEDPPDRVSLYEVAVDRRDAVAPAVRVVRS